MALSNEQRERAFDSGWSAAKEAEEGGGNSLLGNALGYVLGMSVDLATLLLDNDTEEWQQEYERGYRAYQKHSESNNFNDDIGRESYTASETYEVSTSYANDVEPVSAAEVRDTKSRNRTPWVAVVAVVAVVVAVLALNRGSRPKINNSTPITIPSYISQEHQRVLRAWLRRNPNFSLADDADCSCPEERSAILESSNNDHLYYAVEDLNRDGGSDFAVVLVDEVKHRQDMGFCAALAVFNGPFFEGMEPSFLSEGIGEPYGAVLFWNPEEGQLAACKWESECSVLIAGSNGYSLE